MSDKYIINSNELDAEDLDEDPTEIIDGQTRGDEMDEIAEDPAPWGNDTLLLPWQLPYCPVQLLFLLQFIYAFFINKPETAYFAKCLITLIIPNF